MIVRSRQPSFHLMDISSLRQFGWLIYLPTIQDAQVNLETDLGPWSIHLENMPDVLENAGWFGCTLPPLQMIVEDSFTP